MAMPTVERSGGGRDVTVVIPTRNRSGLLRRSLASVTAQAGVELAVVVVDDGSTDDTGDVVRGVADDRVRLVRNDVALGVSGARNAGLAAVETTWVAFLDDDDLWAPTRLATQLDAMGADDRWAVSGAVVVDEALRLIGAQRPPAEGSLPAAILRYNCIPGGASGVLASTALVREVGGFDPTLSILADWDLWTRLALLQPPATVSRPHVAYVLHGANMTVRPRGFSSELDHIRVRYDGERAARGVRLDEAAWELWLAEVAYRGGARRGPIMATWRAAVRRRSPRLLARGVSMGVRPGWLRRRDAHRRETLPDGWQAEAELWLGSLTRR